MCFSIYVNDKCINCAEFGLEADKVQSVEELEKLITLIDKRRVCQGCQDIELSETNLRLLQTFASVNRIKFVQSNHCPILLPEDEKDEMPSKYKKTMSIL